MRWEELREEGFQGAIARPKGVCVLPLGCLEKHGQALIQYRTKCMAEAYKLLKDDEEFGQPGNTCNMPF